MLDSVAGMIKEQLEEQDEVGLIHFFTENNEQFHELSTTISSLSQDLPIVSSRKCYLDVDAANAQIASLQGLHLLIAGLSNDPNNNNINNNTHNTHNTNGNNTTNKLQHTQSTKQHTTRHATTHNGASSPINKNSTSNSRPPSQTRTRASPSPSYSRPSSSTRR